MAQTARSQGANARAQGWGQAEEAARGRTGSWLPLDALNDDELFAAGPQLQAMPASRRMSQPLAPTASSTRPQTSKHTVSQRVLAAVIQPHTQQQPQQQAHTAPQESISNTRIQSKAVAVFVLGVFSLLVIYVAVSSALSWVQVKADDMTYGRPRTMQLDAYVGHGETGGAPSHFIAMNLNRRVTIMELPGGDSTKATTIVGPYLFGQNEDLTPVQLASQDLNADGKPDLIVSVKNEQLLYLNDGTSFRLASADERAAIEKAMQAQANTRTQQAQAPEAGK